MAKHQFSARLGSLLSIAVLAGACAGGEIGSAPGAPRVGAGDLGGDGAPFCPGASPDVSASNGWLSSQASQAAVDTLYLEFKARPTAANLDGLMAVGTGDIDDFAKAAITVRFAADGLVDVRDGAFYSADISYPYEPGAWYTVAIAADIANKIYDVEIGPCGEPRETLIHNASFRDNAGVNDELSAWGVWSSQAAALELSTPAWMTSGDCAPATCQSLGHQCGAPNNGCGGTLSCGSCPSGQTCSSGFCVDNAPPPPPPGGGGPDPSGRGPTGQWPAGFPAYNTAADIVTNGTKSGLTAALNDTRCSGGCVIEHPGNVSGTLSRIGSAGEILVRPPIGQRAQYTFSGGVDIRADNLLVAGFDNDSNMVVSKGTNSGFAWMEIDGPGGGIAVYGNDGDTANGFFYEVVYRQYAASGMGDRGGVRATSNGHATMLVVGSILTGTTDPPPTYHADTLQIYYEGGSSGEITIRDSVLWPAYDKALQAGAATDFFLDNVFIMSPGEANNLWTGPGAPLGLGGYYSTTASVDMNGCTIVGALYPDFDHRVSNSALWKPGNYIDMGGNTTLSARPSPTRYPTHAELDAIWSP